MTRRKPNGSDALSTPARPRRCASRLGTLLVVVALAACTAAPGATPDPTSSTAPATASPSATTAAASPGATPGSTGEPATSPLDPTPSPTTDPAGWSTLALAPAVAVGAELEAVRGSAAAMSPRDGVLLRATGDVPVAALAARLRVEPPVDYAVIPGADGRSAVLRPATALPSGARYRFILLDDEGAPLTAWAFQVGGPLRVVATIPGDTSTDVPATTGIEVTFDRDGVSLDPADVVVRRMTDGTKVAGRLERHGRSIAFVPEAKLRAGAVYQVTLRTGAGAGDGLPGLPQAVAFSFRVATTAKLGSRHAVFEEAFVTASPGERALFRASAWHTRADDDTESFFTPLRLRVYRLASETAGLEALGRLLGGPTWYGNEGRPTVATKGLPIAYAGMAPFVRAGWDARLRIPVALERGWYLVELRETDVNQAILQVADVAAMVGARDDRMVVWANSTATGRPIGDASVAVVGGPSLGRTDAKGVLVAPTPDEVATPAGPVFVRVIAPNKRRAVVWLGDSESPKGYGDWLEARQSGVAGWWSALATDRWLYRATDTVEAWGYLRSRKGALASTVELRVWRDTDGERIGPLVTAMARRAPTGAFAAQLAIADLPYGWYVLESVADGQPVEEISFEVGDLRKPAYDLTVAAAPRAVISGATVKATVTARFFDGTPVARLPLVVSADEIETRDGETVRHRVTTSTAGRGSATITARVGSDSGQESCGPVSARPEGAEEAAIEGHRAICVYRAAVYVDATAIRDGGSIVVSGSVHEVDLAAVAKQLARGDRTDDWWDIDPRGDPVAGRTVRIVITEQVLRRVVTARWYDPISKQVVEESETEVVRETTTTRTATTRADGTFRLRFTAQAKDRSWEIEARVRDRAGRTTFAGASVESAADEHGPATYNVRLRGERSEFSIGAPVTAEIGAWTGSGWRPAPSNGANRYLFVVASAGRLQPAVRTSPVLRTTFRASDEPNLQVTAVWFTGEGYVAAGDASAMVDVADRTVAVKLSTDKKRYAPGATATIQVRTTGRGGTPVPATVLLRGVDEKIVAMGAAGLADPLDMLYRPIPVGFVQGPAVTHAVWLRQTEGGSTTGGDGDGDGSRDDLADAIPVTMVTTGADGAARVEIRLPEDVTAWRIGAAAITADRRAGQAAIKIPVGLPFFVEATIAPEYLVGDKVAIRVRAFGTDLEDGAPVRFRVASKTLAMKEVVVDGQAFTESLVPLPALTEGTHEVSIAATSAAGRDTLVRRFAVVTSRLRAAHRETVAIDGPTAVPGGDGLTRLVIADEGRGRYLDRLLGLAVPAGQRSDERLAAAVARDVLAASFDLEPGDLPATPPFERSAYQRDDGGLALLPYGSSDLELTVRALVADPDALLGAASRGWLRAIADDGATTLERRAVALAGLAALGDPVLGELAEISGRADAGGRIRLWAALGLALLGDTGRAAAVERSILERWGERRGDLVRLRISGDAEEVSQATDLAALVAALVDDPLAADLLAYVVTVPPRDTLASLTEATVLARIVGDLEARTAVVAVVRDGRRTTLDIPAGGSVVLEVLAVQRSGMQVEPVSGSASMTALWEVPTTPEAGAGKRDPDLALQRGFSPAPPVAANRLVTVRLRLDVHGPGRDGETEVVELVPSGLVAVGAAPADADECGEEYHVAPSRIEGQRVTFVVSYAGPVADDEGQEGPTVPGRFCLDYTARVVTAGTYAWEPAVARQTVSPALVAVAAASTVELR